MLMHLLSLPFGSSLLYVIKYRAFGQSCPTPKITKSAEYRYTNKEVE
jgi:hypothetical protein